MTCDGRRAQFAEETAQRLASEMTHAELRATHHRHAWADPPRPRLTALTRRALIIKGHEAGRLSLLDPRDQVYPPESPPLVDVRRAVASFEPLPGDGTH